MSCFYENQLFWPYKIHSSKQFQIAKIKMICMHLGGYLINYLHYYYAIYHLQCLLAAKFPSLHSKSHIKVVPYKG